MTFPSVNTPPQFTSTGPFSVLEGAASGTVVGDVDANDGDGGSTDAGVTYSITGGNTGSAFAIDANGVITVNAPSAVDFESIGSFSLTVEADDGGSSNNTNTASVTVNVTDAPPSQPTDANGATNAVAENASTGTTVGVTASASDPAGGTVTYVLTDDAGGRFQIDGSTGVVTVANGSLIDFETATSHTIVAAADDADGTRSSTNSFTIGVTNVDEAPVFTATGPFSVSESAASSTVVGDVDATDGDGGATDANVTYAIVSGNVNLDSDANQAFAIDGATGVITVNDPDDLDHEVVSSASLTVEASDGTSSPTTSVSISIIDVNEAPTLTLSTTTPSLAENNTAPVAVSTITINDDPAGTNSLFLSGADAGSFQINGSDLEFTAVADFETKSSYSVTVNVDDTSLGSGAEDSETVTLSITDVNEAPSLALSPASASLPEDTDTSTPVDVSTITITDDALGTNNLSLSGGDAGSFQITGSTLQLQSGVTLTPSTLTVTVNVNDPLVGASPDDSETFTLTVTDVNSAPTVSLSPTSASIAEGTTTPVVVSTITINDDGTGTNTLSLAGTDAGAFNINASDELEFTGTADFETQSSYSVTVNVDDTSVGSTPDDSEAFTLTITDATEAPTASTGAASSIALASATLNGTASTGGGPATTVEFVYFPTASPSSTTRVTADQSPVSSASPVSVSANISGLMANTQYTFRVESDNGEGTAQGSDVTFTTSGAPEINVTAGGTLLPDGSGTFDFGTVDVVVNTPTQEFVIGNTGSANLILSGTTLSNSTDFSLTSSPTSPVGSNSSTSFTVQFDATAPGSYSTTVTIANNDSDEDPYTFEITATAGAPEADVFVETSPSRTALADGGTFNFGAVTVSGSRTETFTIENNGDATLTVVPPSSIPGVFDITATGGTAPPLAPGQSFTFDVRFSPTSATSFSQSFSVSNNDANENPYDVTLEGTGANASPTLSANTGSTTNRGAPVTIPQSQLEFTDANDGPADLTYTVTSGPSTGQLLVNGTAASTFTQQDVNDGLLTYLNDGTSDADDAFDFTVTDGTTTTATQTFSVTVDAVANFGASASAPITGGTTGAEAFGTTGVSINFTGALNTGTVNVIRIDEVPANTGTVFSGLQVGNQRYVVTVIGPLDVSAGVALSFSPPANLPEPNATSIYQRPDEGTGTFTAQATSFDGSLLSTTVTGFSEFATASSSTFATTIVGEDGTGNDVGFRMLAFPGDIQRQDLEDDLDFNVSAGALMHTFPGGDASGSAWVEVNSSTTSISRGSGFVLYFFDDATDPLESSGITLDVPDNTASGDLTSNFDVTGFDVSDEFELVGNPYEEDFDLDALGRDGNPTTTTLGDAGFSNTVCVWNGDAQQFEFFTQGDPGDVIPAFNSFVLQRITTGSGDTALEFDVTGKQGSQSTPVGSKSSHDSDVQLLRLQVQLTTSGGSVKNDRVAVRYDPAASDGWDAFDFGEIPPPVNADGAYLSATVPTLRGSRLVQRAYASEAYVKGDVLDVELPLAVRGIQTSGTATIAWPSDLQGTVSDAWIIELVDTQSPSGSEVVHDLRTGGAYTFEVSSGGSLSSPDDARFRLRVSNGVIPVELAAFGAAQSGSDVQLTWQTASETNNAGFAIERRIKDTDGWSEIAFVEGAGTTSSVKNYRFTDASVPFTAESITYRLRQTDLDGTTSFSDEKTLALSVPDEVRLHAPFPNPTRGAVTLRYELPDQTDVEIAVFDLLGRRVAHFARGEKDSGRKEVQVSTSTFAPGLYFVRLRAGGTIQTQRMTVIR